MAKMGARGLSGGGRRTRAMIAVAVVATVLGVPLVLGQAAASADSGPGTPLPQGAPAGDSPPVDVDPGGELDPGSLSETSKASAVASFGLVPGSLGDFGCLDSFHIRRSTLPAILDDVADFDSFPVIRIGDGSGDIGWAADPFNHASWRLMLHSLRWTMPLLWEYRDTHDQIYLDKWNAIVQDWITDNRFATLLPSAQEGVAMRVVVMLCAYELEPDEPWLRASLSDHAAYMTTHYSGAWNHGLDENLSLFGIGCVLGNPTYAGYAVTRLSQMGPAIIDSTGVSNEQSIWYGVYTYGRLDVIKDRLSSCGYVLPESLAARRLLMPPFFAHATLPDGTMAQLGDTYADPMLVLPGTAAEYPATLGRSGRPPSSLFAVYPAGYAFGRSSWNPADKPMWYGFRFGPPRKVHGHDDKQSILYWADDRLVLTEGGHYGYPSATDPYRRWLIGQDSHNHVSVVGGSYRNVTTTLVQRNAKTKADYYEVTDTGAYPGVTRTRSVLVTRTGPRMVLALDRVSSTSATQRVFQQLWHLPATMSARPVSDGTVLARDAAGNQTLVIQAPFPGQRVPLHSASVVRAASAPLQGWVSPHRTERIAAPTVRMSKLGRSAEFLTIVIPLRSGQGAWYRITLRPDGYALLWVKVGAVEGTYLVGHNGWLAAL
jgi:hypothetical protein